MNDDLIMKEEKAYSYAIYLLGLKLRTEGEIKSKLQIKNFKFQIIEQVILRLKENKYLDDQRYAEVYLDNLKKYKTFGYYGIKKKLMEKRLPSAIIESVLNKALSEEEEKKIAKRFVKKFELENMEYKEKQKLAQKMKSKGFRMGVIVFYTS
jgi:regulatory protein